MTQSTQPDNKCNICPRRCNIDRTHNKGYCLMNDKIMAARAALHMWEEPCISGVNLKEGYNGDLTSAEAGSVGGNMVKKMIRKQEEQMSQGGN